MFMCEKMCACVFNGIRMCCEKMCVSMSVKICVCVKKCFCVCKKMRRCFSKPIYGSLKMCVGC